MLTDQSSLRHAVETETRAAAEFLREIISIPSVSGSEEGVMPVIAGHFEPLLDELERVPFPPDFLKDPEYSSPVPGLRYDTRFNLRGVLRGTGSESLLFNTHADVVPASQGHVDPFVGRIVDGTVFGRGACDAKGQVAALYLMLRVLRRIERKPARTLILHLVTEEENGGNGTLAMMRQRKEQASEAVTLEPTGCRLATSVRGAVWFRLTFRGVAGHSGSAVTTVSALKLAIEAVGLLERYQSDLLEASRSIALFDQFPNPMPITFGKLNAGNWPAAAPSEAVLEGVLGFLPNRTREQVIAEMTAVLREQGSPALRDGFEIELMYRHNAHVTAPDSPLAAGLLQACERAGLDATPTAFPASADSWFYPHFLGIPTVIFGPGELRHAHSAEEQLSIEQLAQAGQVLTDFVLSRV